MEKQNDITKNTHFECFLHYQNTWKAFIYENERWLQETRNVYLCVFQYVRQQKGKKHRKLPYSGIKNVTKNESFESFVFTFYAKTHAKHLLWRNRIKLPKTYILRVLMMLPIKTLKFMQSTLCLRKERTLREMCIISVFKFHKYQKPKTHQ